MSRGECEIAGHFVALLGIATAFFFPGSVVLDVMFWLMLAFFATAFGE